MRVPRLPSLVAVLGAAAVLSCCASAQAAPVSLVSVGSLARDRLDAKARVRIARLELRVADAAGNARTKVLRIRVRR